MQKYFADLLEHFQELHQEIEKIIESLPTEALDWSPGAEMNSLTVLIVHVTGSERFWIGDVALGQPSNRDRPAEFQARQWGKAALLQRLNEAYAFIQSALGSLEISDLVKSRGTSPDGHPVNVGWAIAHSLEHTAIHVGHLQLMRQLWEQKT